MKGIKLLIVILFCLPLMASSGQETDDMQKVKDALVNSVIYCQSLEKQVANMNATIQKVAEDLRKVETIEQLDSLKVVYGIKKK
jgi:hydroxyethylthiazole kinase-like sugar kinase family protein